MNTLSESGINKPWETERITALRVIARNGVLVGFVGAVVAIIAVTALIVVEKARQFVPVPIVIDKATGETTTALPLSSSAIPPEEALDKANITKYVLSREGYAWDFLQRDYDTVARMSSPEIFKPYATRFEGPDAIDKKLGANTIHRVRVVNVRLDLNTVSANKSNSRRGEAIVTFERETRLTDRTTYDPPTRHIVTARYEYQPKSTRTERDRLENPLGFVVLAYRTDQELTETKK